MNSLTAPPVRATEVAWRIVSRVPLTLLMAAAAPMIAILPSLGELLQFDREAIGGGEAWRLATCHLCHWSFEHLKWDVLMFMVLGVACEWRDPRRMRWCVLASAAAVITLVALQFPEIAYYRGLSGIDTALFTLLAIDLVRDAVRDRNWLLATATGGMFYGFAAKTLFEATTGRTLFVDVQTAGFMILVWDHVIAGVVGLCCAVAFRFGTWAFAGGIEQSLYLLRRKIGRYKRWAQGEFRRRVLT